MYCVNFSSLYCIFCVCCSLPTGPRRVAGGATQGRARQVQEGSGRERGRQENIFVEPRGGFRATEKIHASGKKQNHLGYLEHLKQHCNGCVARNHGGWNFRWGACMCLVLIRGTVIPFPTKKKCSRSTVVPTTVVWSQKVSASYEVATVPFFFDLQGIAGEIVFHRRAGSGCCHDAYSCINSLRSFLFRA